MKYDLKGPLLYYGYVVWFFTLRLSDLKPVLTYVLMGNFCPCFDEWLGLGDILTKNIYGQLKLKHL